MVPGGDMVVVAGDINVDRHGDEYPDMLGALSLTVPGASLGWPYSYDTHNNTIGEIRDGTGAPRAVARVLARLDDTEDDAVAQVGAERARVGDLFVADVGTEGRAPGGAGCPVP
ncbi:hypothetical protein [Streptomyces sp. NPDC056672]|uniref:hypothetical protein n=1 Tax=Streptomyces sp. NPDC056672 TaxID=3345906 RepID=UPI0036857607